ncbi:hypothetical protein Q1695_001743 [Nippostrongylus brasiliensis]|nr:hypothetical protein Q1695_001743 [Nippostrongylus brasiliensis]
MVTVRWSAAGLIHHSFLKPGEKMTSEKYCQELDEMHSKLQRIYPRLVNTKGPIILHDNARPHVSIMTRQKLHELGYEALDHPPAGIEKLACRWQKCVDSNGFYFD